MDTSYSRLICIVTLAGFAIHAPVIAADPPAAAGAYDKKLELQGITFHVTCPNKGSLNRLTIVPAGLTGENPKIEVEVDGTVTGAEVGDLNVDGSPEIYVYTQSAGSGSYGSVIAYSANKKKSLSPVTLPDLLQNKKASKGYMGHDEFAVVENHLVRRFKLYEVADTNSKPTGKTRQISYRLEAGEAGWILRAEKIADI
jgi:hypothetical protein